MSKKPRIRSSDTYGEDYKPLNQEKENIKLTFRGDSFQMSGDKVFHTLQGEGPNIGKPATFIRLAFCNLACSFCDSFYTWKKDTPEFWKETWNCQVADLKKYIQSAQLEKNLLLPCNYLVFTGGEPLLQQLKIIHFLNQNLEFTAEIETNGTILPDKSLIELITQKRVSLNCSPKLKFSGNNFKKRLNQKVLESINQYSSTTFKFVCEKPLDLDEIKSNYAFLDIDKIYVMPEGVTKEENTAVYEKINTKLISYGYKTTPRLQNIMFDGAKRGV